MEKICIKCSFKKDFNLFNDRKTSKDGKYNICKDCQHKEYEKYHHKNKEAENERSKTYYHSHKETSKIKSKEYRQLNKESISKNKKEKYPFHKDKIIESNRVRNKIRRHTDSTYKLSMSIRRSVSKYLKNNGYKKTSKTAEIIGCSSEFLKEYIESKFQPWMNWNNHGKYNGQFNYGWDLDHIIPIASAKTKDELIKLFHYTNLQPLCSKVNRYIKKDNIITSKLQE